MTIVITNGDNAKEVNNYNPDCKNCYSACNFCNFCNNCNNCNSCNSCNSCQSGYDPSESEEYSINK